MADKKNFTKRLLDSLKPQAKRYYVYDEKVPGLAVSVTPKGTISFLLYRKHQGKPVRITLGRYPALTIPQARNQAQQTLATLAGGVNPIEQRREREAAEITLAEAFQDYIRTRKNLKETTIKDYNKAMETAFKDWLNKPLSSITKDKVRKRHEEHGQRSKAQANMAMRVLRAVFNFAAEVYEDNKGISHFPINPVTVLSKTRAWHKVERRRTYIKAEDLPAWFDAVLNIQNNHPQSKVGIFREYILFVMFTGCRKTEAATLKWVDVNLGERVFTLKDTKNGEVVTLPLNSFLAERLETMRAASSSEFVFPSDESKTGHIVNTDKMRGHIQESAEVAFTLHDLRRTFITVGESLDISSYTLKRLVNHKTVETLDVTAGYIVTDINRLRIASEKIANAMLTKAGIVPAANVVSLQRA